MRLGYWLRQRREPLMPPGISTVVLAADTRVNGVFQMQSVASTASNKIWQAEAGKPQGEEVVQIGPRVFTAAVSAVRLTVHATRSLHSGEEPRRMIVGMPKSKLLLTNDDGIDFVGLHILAEAMQEIGDVTIVAPDTEYSGSSDTKLRGSIGSSYS